MFIKGDLFINSDGRELQFLEHIKGNTEETADGKVFEPVKVINASGNGKLECVLIPSGFIQPISLTQQKALKRLRKDGCFRSASELGFRLPTLHRLVNIGLAKQETDINRANIPRERELFKAVKLYEN